MMIKEIVHKGNVINEIVDIHMSTFSGFFLTFMGRGFLKVMYQSYCEYNEAGIIGAFNEEGNLVGFLSYSGNMSGLYKYMIKRKLPLFAMYSIGAFFRKPGIFVRLLRAFLKPSESRRDEKYVELSSIGVKPEFKAIGVGTQLMDYFKNIIDFNEYKYINLETDAVDNDKVNSFYKKNGFLLTRTYETAEKRKMNEYRFYQKDKVLI